jgi:hypothetical protein
LIESFIEGRLRLRSPLLADAAFAECLRDGLSKIDGVWKAEVNPRTNGLLLEYDKKLLPLSSLKEAAPLLLRVDELERRPCGERVPALKGILAALSEKLAGLEKR